MKIRSVKYLLFLSIFFLSNTNLISVCFGNSTYKFQKIGIKDGLSQSSVLHIIQDKRGFMWFATYYGLNKYDGQTFTTYKHDLLDSNSMNGNGVVYLHEDRNAYIWVINDADYGICKFDPKTEKFKRYLHDPKDSTSISSNSIKHIFEDKAGNIWIKADNAINLLVNTPGNKNGEEHFIHIDISSLDGEVTWIHENRFGDLLLFANYAYKLNKENLTAEIICDTRLPDGSYKISSLIEDEEGNIIIGSALVGNFKLNYKESTHQYVLDEINELNICPKSGNYVIKDHKNRIWIATQSEGLYQYNPKTNKWLNFQHSKNDLNSLSENTLRSLYIDRTGVLWIGTSSKGICKYDLYQKKFDRYPEKGAYNFSLTDNVISSIHSTTPNELWFGGHLSGIYNIKFKGDYPIQTIHFKHDPNNSNSLQNNNTLCLVQRKNGEVWSGCSSNVLTIIYPEKSGTGKTPMIKKIQVSGYIFSIFEDKQGTMWGGTWGSGLWKYNEKVDSFTYFMNNPDNSSSIICDIIWAIYEDSFGNLWIGGHDKGISILPASEKNKEDPKFINYNINEYGSEGLSGNPINGFLQTKDGTMWICTSLGLNKVKEKDFTSGNLKNLSFESFHIKDGLPSEIILGMVEDNNNNLWLSTSIGISQFNTSSLQFKSYTTDDGLLNTEYSRNANFKNENGKIYLGGHNGYDTFYPDSIKDNPFIPDVAITNLKLFTKPVKIEEKINGSIILSKSISETSEIRLSYKNKVITLEFAALHFAQPQQNQYAYILEGFDHQWNYEGNKTQATYTNLNPGEYIFRVKASNNDGVWNEKGTSLKITVIPPFWKTWWFRIILFLCIGSLIGGIYFIRVSSLQKQKLLLEKLVRDRTFELNETNTLLEERQQQIEEQSDVLKSQSERLLLANRELKKINATKDKLFTIIAHDLKSPFSSVLGFSQLLHTKWDSLNRKKAKTISEMINSSSQRIYNLLENLLEWARSQSGSLELKIEKISLFALAQENINLLSNALAQKNNKVEIKIPENLVCYADTPTIKTVIRNIISNANKFTENGSITIRTEIDGDYVKMIIQDSGVGIPKETVKYLFEVKRSKSTSGTQGEEGTGLGLLVCKEFIQKNNGTIYAESELNIGTTIIFTLPIRNNKPQKP